MKLAPYHYLIYHSGLHDINQLDLFQPDFSPPKFSTSSPFLLTWFNFLTRYVVNTGWWEIDSHRCYSQVKIACAPICTCKDNGRIWHHNASSLDVRYQLWWRHNAKSQKTVFGDNGKMSDRCHFVTRANHWQITSLVTRILNLIPAWICNPIPYKVRDEITCPFLNFNGCTVDVWEWTSNFIPHSNWTCDYLSMLRLKLIHVGRRGQTTSSTECNHD